ncbi:hypothetical protein EDB80DRAFT_548765, partial [Ilyonectria destructans]
VLTVLEIVREGPEHREQSDAEDILQTALSGIWQRIEAAPKSCIMTRDEFKVFNFFQHQYQNSTAEEARSRYWDNLNG